MEIRKNRGMGRILCLFKKKGGIVMIVGMGQGQKLQSTEIIDDFLTNIN